MKCERHPEEDAVGLCLACGRGVCESCRVIYRGVVHCSTCVREGRHAPTVEQEVGPRPRGTPSRGFFLAGVLGAVLLFLGALFTMAFDLIVLTAGAPVGVAQMENLYGPQVLVTSPLLGLGVVLLAAGILGFYWNYGQVLATGVLAFLVIAAVVYLIPPLAVPTLRSPYLYGPYLPAVILWGTAWVLVGVSFLMLPRAVPRDREILVATGVLWVVAGVLLGTFFGDYYGFGWLPFSLGAFFAYRAFAALPVAPGPAPQGVATAGAPWGTALPPPPPAVPAAVGLAARTPSREPPPYPDFPDAPRR